MGCRVIGIVAFVIGIVAGCGTSHTEGGNDAGVADDAAGCSTEAPSCYPGTGPVCCRDPVPATCYGEEWLCEGDAPQLPPHECEELDPQCGAPGEIVCGASTCDSATEICLGCDHGGSRDVHCVDRGMEDFFAAADSLADAHGCNYFGSLFIECDDSEDCAADEECVFDGGEAGYAFCAPAGEYPYGVSCADSSECSDEAPACTEIDPFGYFGPYEDLLGWLPRACGESNNMVNCGETSCDVGTEVCRWPLWDAPGSPSCEPIPEDGWGTNAWFLYCDGPEDCPTGACAIIVGGSANWARCGDVAGLCRSLADCPDGATDCRTDPELPSDQYKMCSFD